MAHRQPSEEIDGGIRRLFPPTRLGITGRTRRSCGGRRGRAGTGPGRCSRGRRTRPPSPGTRRGCPAAQIICTTSSGTSFDAATTWSWVAGQVRIPPMSSSSDSGTPEAFMMCGCWPRYWVTSRRAASRATWRSSSTEHTMSWGRSRSSSGPADGLRPGGQVLQGPVVVGGGDQVVEQHAVGDAPGQLHHLHPGRPDVDGHVLGAALLVHVVQLHAVEVHELAVVGHGLVGQQGPDDRRRSPASPAAAGTGRCRPWPPAGPTTPRCPG